METSLLNIPGIHVHSLIGEGASSFVYRAEKEGQTYALKVQKESSNIESSAGAAVRFRREAAILASLSDSAFVNVHEVGSAGGRLYLLLDLVEGRTLAEKLRAGALSESEAIQFAWSLCGALRELHLRGLIYRDLKPQNIMLNANAEVRIIDFGLVSEINETDPTKGETAGTLLYSSPEQCGAIRRPIDSRSDLYSLGMVLFEMTTGRPAFLSMNPADLIRSHASIIPTKANLLNPEISADLSEIISQLLEKDPDNRYSTALAVIKDLQKLKKSPKASKTHSSPYISLISGRPSEKSILRSSWEQVVQGKGRSLLIEGDPGTGKSFLIRDFVKELSEDRPLAAICGKYTEVNPIPFSALKEAISDFFQQLQRLSPREREDIRVLLRQQCGSFASILRKFTPELTELFSDASDLVGAGEASGQFFTAMTEFFLTLARVQAGLILVIDDIQWTDEASQQVFRRIASQIPSTQLLILFTARKEPQHQLLVNRLCQDLSLEGEARIHLQPLTEKESDLLIRQILGKTSIDSKWMHALYMRTSGNPLAIKEYVTALIEEGALNLSAGQWVIQSEELDGIRVSGDFAALVLRRVQYLEPDAREALKLGAAIGRRISPDLLRDLTSWEDARLSRVLEELASSGLIERSGSDFVFFHDSVRHALYNEVPSTQRQGLHQRIAEALERASTVDSEKTYSIARHYSQGDTPKNPKRVRETNLAAGLLAYHEYADQEALSFLDVAAKIEISQTLYHYRGLIFSRVGRFKEAVQDLTSALKNTTDALNLGMLYGELCWIRIQELDAKGAETYLDAAFKALGRRMIQGKPTEIPKSALTLILSNVLDKTKWRLNSARGRSREIHRLMPRLHFLNSRVGYYRMSLLQLVLPAFSTKLSAHLLGNCPEATSALSGFAICMAGARNIRTAEKFFQRALNAAKTTNDLLNLAMTSLLQTWGWMMYGDYTKAEALNRIALQKYGRWLPISERLNLTCSLALLLKVRGRHSEALDFLEGTLEIAYKEASESLSIKEHPAHDFLISPRSILGRSSQVLEDLGLITNRINTIQDPYNLGIAILNLLEFHLDRGEYGQPFDNAVAKYVDLKIPLTLCPFMVRPIYIFIAYGRLEQLNLAPNDSNRIKAVEQALKTSKTISQGHPLLENHQLVIEAALLGHKGKAEKAFAAFSKAEHEARQTENLSALFEIHLHRGQLFARLGNSPAAREDGFVALGISEREGWINKAKRIKDLFRISKSAPADASGYHTYAGTSTSANSSTEIRAKRYLDSLLQVSLAPAGILDVNEQARIVVDEMIKLLGAERAFLLLWDEKKKAFTQTIGRDSVGNFLPELRGYSSTVVAKVQASGTPLVVSGTEQGAVLGSESIVVHNLRSIIAAPLKINEKILGVIYLDNRLVKGVFTEEDVEILTALGNHIALFVETSRVAQSEMARRELEKDFAVTAAVQTLFLPKKSSFQSQEIKLEAFYRPAAKCGGDWWWFDPAVNEGSGWLMLGDVTGHGPGPAMVTAAVASGQRMFSNLHREKPISTDNVDLFLSMMNTNIGQLCDQKYLVSMSTLLVDSANDMIHVWSAGAPPVMIMTPDRKLEVHSLGGAPLGLRYHEVERASFPFHRGSRALVFTDGLMNVDGIASARPTISLNHVKTQFQEFGGRTIQEMQAHLRSKVDAHEADKSLEDDVAFVILERV